MLYAWLSLGGLILCLIALPVSLIALLFRQTRRKAKWIALASTVGAVASFVSFGYQHDLLRGSPNRLEKPFLATPRHADEQQRISPAIQQDILRHKITLGMTPHEARLAGGSFFFKVEADPLHWPQGSDPLIVIASQTTRPDDSKITLTFRNSTQFDSQEPVTFRVEVRKGRVADIVAVKTAANKDGEQL
jgi:hypothetical protein